MTSLQDTGHSDCGVVPGQSRKVGLALGSGSARGLAHIGVIRAIEAAGIEVDVIAGTSIGALIGAIQAAGQLEELETTFQSFDWKITASFFDVVLPRSGLLDGAKVSALLRSHVQAKTIEALPTPFACVATDIVNGEEIVIRSGDLIEAVRASVSVPGIFTPVRSNGRILVDGGLTNPVPISVVRAMGAGLLIAVDLNQQIVPGKNFKPVQGCDASTSTGDGPANKFSRWVGDYRLSMTDIKRKLIAGDDSVAMQFRTWLSQEPLANIFDVLLASINIMETRITQSRLSLDRPDLLIQPPVGHIRFLNFGHAEEIIAIGYEHTRRLLASLSPHILRNLQKRNTPCE